MATVPAVEIRFAVDSDDRTRDRASAALMDFDAVATHECSTTEWRVFFRSAEERDRAAEALRAYGEAIAVDVADEDWARRSQESLHAIRVGQLIVAPPWDLPISPDIPVVVIEPSVGFGTGHHATTRLCLRAVQRIDLRGKRVLDIGTGSGVLAIAAAKLGASHVIAVDNDPDALQAARENVTRNGVAVVLRPGDLRRDRLPAADVVLANLTGPVLQWAAAELAALARGGTLVTSGLVVDDADAIVASFAPFSSDIRLDEEDGWASLVCAVP